jgi:hypothetical protein
MATRTRDVIKDTEVTMVAANVKPDYKKRRVVLPKGLVQEGITFHVYLNSFGQIVLDPQATIPASELWVFENKEILASIDKGMAESAKGRTINRGSFAKYVKDAS